MIKLSFCSDGIFIFNVDDWFTLRKSFRIIGEIVGDTSHVPALPIKLTPEEAILLLDQEKVIIEQNEYLFSTDKKQEYQQYEEKLLKEQQILHRDNRKKQLELIIDDIVQAKRKKGDERNSEEIFKEELERSCRVSKEQFIWPIFLTPLTDANKCRIITRDEILKNTTELKVSVYKDLWENGYYITQGHKFGGDFLVYKGDPVLFHAIFIVRCVEDKENLIHPSEVVAFGRLGTSVRKRSVLAYLNEDKVSYITINWIDA